MKLLLKILGVLVVTVVAILGGFLAVTWAPDLPVDELKARWAPAPSQFIEVRGMQVHLRDEGRRDDPVPIVLLHGTSASLHTWDGWVEALQGSRRVIRFDLPGFGLTGPEPNNNYRMESYVGFVTEVLDQLGVERFVLAGNSLGGRIAWSTAVAHPQRVAQLILVDSSGYPMRAKSMPIGFRIAQMPVLNQLMELTLPRSMVESSVHDVYADPSLVTEELVDRYYELTLREGNRGALRERFSQLSSYEDSVLIKSIQQPTLIIWGAQDQLLPVDDAIRFAQEIQGSEFALFENLGHVPQEEDPAGTVAAVIQFLEKQAASATPAGEQTAL